MAVEDIGVLVPTKIPGLADAADIQEALRVYHYGGTGYEATAAQTSLPAVGIARRLLEITDDITSLENRPSSGGDVATTAPVAGSFTPSGIPNGYIWVDSDGTLGGGPTGATAVFTNSAPTTSITTGTIWVDKDSTDITANPFIPTATINAKGDLLVGSANDSIVTLSAGTNGQVLKANSASTSGLEWAADNATDATKVPLSTVTAKGDLIAASGSGAVTNLAVGNNGETLVADSSTSTGLRYQGNFSAGKNAIINGNFVVNQRSFTSNTATASYNFDRWFQTNGGTSGTLTITPQTFTPGTAPVSGYEGSTYVQCVTAAGANTNTSALLSQRIEDVRTFAGQTATVSFWAKAASGTPKIAVETEQLFGSDGSPSATVTTPGGTATLSTSWARYSVTVSVPSISGKTVGTTVNTSSLGINLWLSAGSDFATRASSIGLQNATFQIWGVQVEAGSTATAFQTATGTIQGELAACQRYLPAFQNGNWFNGFNNTTGRSFFTVKFPTTARKAATGFTVPAASNFTLYNSSTASGNATAITYDSSGTESANIYLDNTAGSPTMTVGFGALMRIGASGYILFTGCEL